ncbi:MAG TPA: PKD domain-containing protein [Saprospiraceae bacterium]|nr:PKD domain-containing protein [Saprospiraceae bacterium]
MRRSLFHIAALVAFLFSFHSTTEARHIVGGGITYECLGNDRYRFTIKIYRDCNCTQCAELDEVANVGIYRCVGDNCGTQSQQTVYGWLEVPLESQRNISPPDYECLIEPDICVEEGTYTFEMTLPASDLSYHVSYQRCCRNITINNLINPESQGATYTVEVKPEAAVVCNNSPVFRNFPPTVICADEPLKFDHSAIDPDGDQLVYEFCAPLQGGGSNTMQAVVTTCVGAAPAPACPPPYLPTQFLPPAYSAEEPMAGDPVVRIDPNTGEITGTPQIQGQFVVGVCVSEYRNGVLLSRTYRDFQFNVENCDPEVRAQLQNDIQIDQQTYGVNSCGSVDIQFINQSFQERFIDDFEWSFMIGGKEVTSRVWDPVITFPGVGTYNGSLILNPNTSCGDTAFILVNVYPDLEADFEYEYDTCVAGEVLFTDLSRTGAESIVEWNWEFGDGNASEDPDPSHLYREPGDIPVTLSILDENECATAITKNIRYYPVPALLVVSPSAELGCEPIDIFFNNLSFPIDDTYDIRWGFGEGGTSGAISPTYTYEDIGTFTVDLSITSPIGCEIDTIFPDLITVLPSPDAGFSFTPPAEELSILNPEVRFRDESREATRVLYDFGDGSTSLMRDPVYNYADTGRYQVTQVVTHPSGCIDTAIQWLDITPEVRFHLPNAFTPNADGLNDEYRGVGIMAGAKNFNMSIWNRWGQQLFSATDPNEGWNGRIYNSGEQAPAGVYVVRVSFIGPRGEKFEYKTFATLIR